ncbi:MAG: hypothetical protein WCA36_16725, partial [Pseudolabrys sp.]
GRLIVKGNILDRNDVHFYLPNITGGSTGPVSLPPKPKAVSAMEQATLPEEVLADPSRPLFASLTQN